MTTKELDEGLEAAEKAHYAREVILRESRKRDLELSRQRDELMHGVPTIADDVARVIAAQGEVLRKDLRSEGFLRADQLVDLDSFICTRSAHSGAPCSQRCFEETFDVLADKVRIEALRWALTQVSLSRGDLIARIEERIAEVAR